MKKIGLDDSDRVLDSYPFELSGGMNQRVGICTAMILHPDAFDTEIPKIVGDDYEGYLEFSTYMSYD